jgi:hypothetical protein
MKNILKKAAEFKTLSDNYRARYEETRGPFIITDKESDEESDY